MVSGRHGRPHFRRRAAAIRKLLMSGKPPICCYCGGPLPSDTRLWDYAHDDSDPTGRAYKGFAHRSCNRGRYAESPRWRGGDPRPIREPTRDERRRARLAERERQRQRRLRPRILLPPGR